MIKIFDTSLRDGMQTPGVGCNLKKRKTIAKAIAECNVTTMEIGMPANTIDFVMLKELSEVIYDVNPEIEIALLARCKDMDVNKSIEAMRMMPEKQKKLVHLFLPTSEGLQKNSMKKPKEKILQIAKDITSRILELKKYCRVEFTPEDAAATKDKTFLFEVINIAIKNGADIINVADTTGWADTEKFGELVEEVVKKGVMVSVHCHNDSGLAVANSIKAIDKGASQVEGTVLGVGERAGNVDWMQVVANLHMRESSHSVNMKKMSSCADIVSSMIGWKMLPNYPVIGINCYRTSSGIHGKAVCNDIKSYHFLEPEIVGRKLDLVLGQTSGVHIVKRKSDEWGINIPDNILPEFTEIMKKEATEKGHIDKNSFKEILEKNIILN